MRIFKQNLGLPLHEAFSNPQTATDWRLYQPLPNTIPKAFLPKDN